MSKAEDFIQEHTSNRINAIQCYDGDCNPQVIYKPWLTPNEAREAVGIAREEMMEKVCQFVQEHHHEYTSWNTEEYELEFNTEQFIQDIKQLIKDE